MATVNDIHEIVDNMYNARSDFRQAYSNLSSGNTYSLETKLTKAIIKAVGTNKIVLDIDLALFSITVIFPTNELASSFKKNIEASVDGVLRSFLEKEFIHCPSRIQYLENLGNKIMDIYTVGESIKILL